MLQQQTQVRMVEQGAPHMALYPSVLVTTGAVVLFPAASNNQPSVVRHRSPQHIDHVPGIGTGGKNQDLQETGLSHPGFKALAKI